MNDGCHWLVLLQFVRALWYFWHYTQISNRLIFFHLKSIQLVHQEQCFSHVFTFIKILKYTLLDGGVILVSYEWHDLVSNKKIEHGHCLVFLVVECTNFSLVKGHCATMEENEIDVVAIVSIALIVVVILIAAIIVAVVPLAIITSQGFFLLKIIFILTFQTL